MRIACPAIDPPRKITCDVTPTVDQHLTVRGQRRPQPKRGRISARMGAVRAGVGHFIDLTAAIGLTAALFGVGSWRQAL